MAQINKSSDYFNTKLYTGTGSSLGVTGVGFQPDATWIKARSGTYGTENHNFYNTISGATKFLIPNGTSAESTDANSITSFDSDGFSAGTRTDINGSSTEYVSWNWLASNTTASNTDGDETSTVSVNTTSGFSIVSWTSSDTTGATIGHGLGVAPKVVIIKNRSGVYDWIVYHSSIGATKALYLNATNASVTSTGFFQDTAPTSTTFRVGSNNNTRGALNDNMIAYCFAEKKGFSKFGSYTGNGSVDGTFTYLGFKPAFVMVKPTVTADNWVMFDNKREGYNVDNNFLYANKSFAENTADIIDFTSNGFKQRSSGGTSNRSGEPFIYMAFAENPLVGTNNIPATAR